MTINMGPEYGKIAIGISAATGVVLVSFLLLKKFGYNVKSETKEEQVGDGVREEKITQEKVEESAASSELQGFIEKDGELQGIPDKWIHEEKNDLTTSLPEPGGQNQQSFILIGEDDIPENNLEGDTPGNATKKSDRSSDESSYDVIENDRLDDHIDDEDVIADNDTKTALDAKAEEDVNSTSMVFVEESPFSYQAKSGSSLFVSADELQAEDNDIDVAPAASDKAHFDKEEIENLDNSATQDNVSVNNSSSLAATLDETNANQEVPLVDAIMSQESETPQKDDEYTSPVEESVKNDDNENLEEQAEDLDNSKEEIPLSAVQDVTLKEELDTDDSNTLDIQKATEVLFTCQNSPGNVTHDDIVHLVEILNKNNPTLQTTVLDSLVKVTAFTQNIHTLRECGCPEILVQRIKDLSSEPEFDEKQMTSICNVLTNLSLDPKIQQQLGDVVPVLSRVVQLEGVSEPLLLSALRPLVNLSSESVHHQLYGNLVSTLYSLLCSGSHAVKVLSVKVLVNLSINNDFVQDLLAAKAPASFINVMDPPCSDDLLLRYVTMLTNLYCVICTSTELSLDASTLAPDSVFSMLSNEQNKSAIRAKALNLTRHIDEDLSYEASKLNNYLS
ncbi:uncharacterized protein LOC106056567 [Biomphalaria glabrata]|uniref:Uncharacterized protein LOC106056567 n=1 Tax=Biomphalaria glabrata TaxID=6526 RepID=A0A9U8E178_BIOGL|nr:uncharacterized protein LOC106056567 [Biomphalaria glabrata]KAI8739450.1 CAunnamed protein product [Biomphalaria glabrata]